MRIALLISCLLLCACTATDQPSSYGNQGVDLNAANAVCLKRGLHPGTYNYQSCYKNRPEVQAYERAHRMNGTPILVKNRSVYSSYRGRSYPVE